MRLVSKNFFTVLLLLHPILGSAIGSNAKIVDQYLLENAPASVVSLISSLEGEALQDAMNGISPARNGLGIFCTQNTIFALNELIRQRHSDDRFLGCNYSFSCDPTQKRLSCENRENDYVMWLGLIEEYTKDIPGQETPHFQEITKGALIAFENDREKGLDFCFGYTFTHLWEKEDLGKASINQYYLAWSGMTERDEYYIDYSAWVGYHQIYNHRHINFPGYKESATTSILGWQLMPHLEVGCEEEGDWGTAEPFISLDWANNFDQGFMEHGAGALDMIQKSHYTSMLKSEVGLRFYECMECENLGFRYIFKEKLSYINKAIFGAGKVTAAIPGTLNRFTVHTLPGTLNLVSFGVDFLFVPLYQNTFYISLSYDGELGSS